MDDEEDYGDDPLAWPLLENGVGGADDDDCDVRRPPYSSFVLYGNALPIDELYLPPDSDIPLDVWRDFWIQQIQPIVQEMEAFDRKILVAFLCWFVLMFYGPRFMPSSSKPKSRWASLYVAAFFFLMYGLKKWRANVKMAQLTTLSGICRCAETTIFRPVYGYALDCHYVLRDGAACMSGARVCLLFIPVPPPRAITAADTDDTNRTTAAISSAHRHPLELVSDLSLEETSSSSLSSSAERHEQVVLPKVLPDDDGETTSDYFRIELLRWDACTWSPISTSYLATFDMLPSGFFNLVTENDNDVDDAHDQANAAWKAFWPLYCGNCQALLWFFRWRHVPYVILVQIVLAHLGQWMVASNRAVMITLEGLCMVTGIWMYCRWADLKRRNRRLILDHSADLKRHGRLYVEQRRILEGSAWFGMYIVEYLYVFPILRRTKV